MSMPAARPEITTPFLPVILPLMSVVLMGFLIIGLALPVLPYHVHDDLRFGTFAVGLVTGAQFAASLALRLPAGRFADTRGGKRAIILGLFLAMVGGGFYLCSSAVDTLPALALLLILTGRAVIGAAESLMITGAMALGLALTGPRHSGRVIAWVGTAMFAAFAVGAPLGTMVFNAQGFLWIAWASVGLPVVAMAAVRGLPDPHTRTLSGPPALQGVLTAVWLPGLGAAFNGVGFAALLSFSTLLFAQRGWATLGWLPLSAFATALIAARLLGGQVIDRIGGARVGILFTFVTAAGQLLMGFAPTAWLAAMAAALTGAGWAMVYPAFGAESVRRAGASGKGVVMAAYSAFPDFAIGVASPLLGIVAARDGIGSVYAWSAAAALIAIPFAMASGRTLQPASAPD